MPKRVEINKIQGSESWWSKTADWEIRKDGSIYRTLYGVKEETAVSCAEHIENGLRSDGQSCWVN